MNRVKGCVIASVLAVLPSLWSCASDEPTHLSASPPSARVGTVTARLDRTKLSIEGDIAWRSDTHSFFYPFGNLKQKTHDLLCRHTLAAASGDAAPVELRVVIDRRGRYEALHALHIHGVSCGVTRSVLQLPGRDEVVRIPAYRQDPHDVQADVLAIAVEDGGFAFGVQKPDGRVIPISGCPDDATTVCPRGHSRADLKEKIDRARQHSWHREHNQSVALIDGVSSAYDLRGFYNALSSVKREYPTLDSVHLGVDDAVAVGVVHDVLTILQTKLPQDTYSDPDAFAEALRNAEVAAGPFDRLSLVPFVSIASRLPPRSPPDKLNRWMVQQTTRDFAPEVYECNRIRNPEQLRGRMMLDFTIEASGNVSSVRNRTHTFQGTEVAECIIGAARRLRFPRTRSELVVNLPFVAR